MENVHDAFGLSGAIYRQIFDIFREMARFEGCDFDSSKYQYIFNYVKTSINDYIQSAKVNLILRHVDLHPILTYAAELDAKIEAEYSDLILWRNKTANLEGIQHMNVTELDRNDFTSRVVWQTFVKKTYENMKGMSLIKKG
jgi:hypothetical protein